MTANSRGVHSPEADAGPSRLKTDTRTHLPTQAPRSSPDFDTITSALSSAPNRPGAGTELRENDLLGSFEDLNSTRAHQDGNRYGYRRGHPPDLLGDDIWVDSSPTEQAQPPNHSQTSHRPGGSAPIHVNLPPRPDEMSPDYTPPLRPVRPRRMSQLSSFSGPSSPPFVSDVGRDIIFHPPSEFNRDTMKTELQSFAQSTPLQTGFDSELRHTIPLGPSVGTSKTRSPASSKLFNTLATTSKLASKWKTAMDPTSSAALPASLAQPGRVHHPGDLQKVSTTALPVEVTHTTPFASTDHIVGSYTAPAGAPGFDAHAFKEDPLQHVAEEEFRGTRLRGRQNGTAEVLSFRHADRVSEHTSAENRTDCLQAEKIPSTPSKAFSHLEPYMCVWKSYEAA